MTDWASIVSQVANIGVGLLTSLLGDTSGSAPQGYTQGDVVWSLDPKTNTVYAYNKGNQEHGLSLVASSTRLSSYQALPAQKNTKVLLTDFPDGCACVGKTADVPDATKANKDSIATVSFAISYLPIATAVKVIGGLHLTVNLDSQNGLYQISLQSTKGDPTLKSANVMVTDLLGNSVSARAEFKSPPSNDTYTFNLPQGVNLDPMVGNLNLGLTMDISSYLRATEDSRRNLVQGAPQSLQLVGARP